MAEKTSDTIIRNTLFNYAGFGWRLLTSFFLVSYILAKIGKEQFGIYVLLETMVTCLALLDLAGIEGAFVKFIAEYHTNKEQEKLNGVISLGFSYYLVFQSVLCFFIYWFREPLFTLFKLDVNSVGDVSLVLLGFLLIALIRGSFRVYRSVLLGIQRLDASNLIDILMTIPNVFGTMFFLASGWGIKGLVANGLIVSILTVSSQIYCSCRIVPGIRLRPFAFSHEIFRAAFYYGMKIQVARFAELINLQIDKLLLGVLLVHDSKAMVGIYELGAKPARSLCDFSSQLLPAILPAASQFDARNDREGLKKLYFRGNKYLLLTTLPLTFFTIANAQTLITFWLGQSLPLVVLSLQILTFGYMTTLSVSMGRLIARGMGIPHLEMRSSILITALNVISSAVMITWVGFVGALWGTALSAIIGSAYFAIMFHRHFGQPFWKETFLPICPIPLLACLVASLVEYGLRAPLEALVMMDQGRLSLFLQLGGRTIIFFAVYLAVLHATRFLDDYDKDVIERVFRPFNKLLQAIFEQVRAVFT